MSVRNLPIVRRQDEDPAVLRAAARALVAQAGYEVSPDLLTALEAVGVLPYERTDGSRNAKRQAHRVEGRSA